MNCIRSMPVRFIMIALAIGGCRLPVKPASEVSAVTIQGGLLENVKVDFEYSPSGQETARFYYLVDSKRHYYQPMFEGTVLVQRRSDRISLTFQGTEIGSLYNGRLYICDRYQVTSAVTFDFPCNANFFNPDFNKEMIPADLQDEISAGYRMDLSLADIPQTAQMSLTDEKFTLENYAQNQINQYGTGTCAYNAATGILEILHAMKTGQNVNFSEPYFLANAPAFVNDTSWFWTKYERFQAETKGMVRDEDLPVSGIYRSGASFSSARQNALQKISANAPKVIPASFGITQEKLFFRAEWKNGYMRSLGRASEQDYRSMVAWFTRHKKPMNVHYWIGDIWHSVIMIGYDPASDSILIKDSLGNSHLKGTWKSKSWFLKYGYSAVGVMEAGSAGGNLPPDNGSDNLTGDQVPDNDPVDIAPPVDEPGNDTVADPAINWAEKFKVKLEVGRTEGRYKQFWLSVSGSEADLARIVEVTYDVHPTFGSYAISTVKPGSGNFRTIKYLTYSRGWRTRGTTVKIKLGGEIKEVKLPGTLISW